MKPVMKPVEEFESRDDSVILFDGTCNLCAAAMRFVVRHDKRMIFRFAPFQSDAAKEICQKHAINPDRLETWLLIRRDRLYSRSDAVIIIAREIGGIWGCLALLRCVPRPVRDWAYRVVARNRYRWFGRRDACLTPSDDLRRRFL